jgi:hypothetical protein
MRWVVARHGFERMGKKKLCLGTAQAISMCHLLFCLVVVTGALSSCSL